MYLISCPKCYIVPATPPNNSFIACTGSCALDHMSLIKILTDNPRGYSEAEYPNGAYRHTVGSIGAAGSLEAGHRQCPNGMCRGTSGSKGIAGSSDGVYVCVCMSVYVCVYDLNV